MFGNTKNIFLKALIVFIIAGSMSSFVYVESHQQIEAQVAVTDSLKKEIRTLTSSFTALKAETADYVSFKALNNSLDDLQVWAMAHVALGDTGNAETMQGFVDNLFTDIKRLTAAASFGQEKNKRLQIDIMSLSQEIQRVKEEAAKNFEVLNRHLTHKESIPPDLSIQSSSAPDILRKAVHKYVSKVSFVSTDKRRYACNMNFNLKVI